MYRSDKSFMRDPATVNSRIYVGNLDESVTPEKLEDHFKTHGTVLGVVVQRGFGFVQFEEESTAQLAIQNEHGMLFQGRKLNVKQAIDSKNKAAGSTEEPVIVGQDISSKSADGPPRKLRRSRGRGARGNLDDREYSDFSDDAAYLNREDSYGGPGSGYVAPSIPNRNHVSTERNDCEIIVVSKLLTEYAEYIEHRLKSIGLTVDLLFPNEDVPIGRVLANISSRGCLYAVLVMPQNEEHRSLTLNILHGIPQEHRNMPIDDAITLISRNFDTYMRGEKTGSASVAITTGAMANERHPEAIQILLNLLADNRQLTTLQYDRIIKYLQEKRELQYKQEVGDTTDINTNQSSKQAELQNRIMSILNKTTASPGAPSPVVAPKVSTLPTASNSAPILNDPSVQKALDSLLQGDILKNITSSGRF